MSSIRVAVKPRATNSSSAASIMAPRRSAARSARLEGSALGDADLDVLDALAGATFSPGRPAAAFAPPRLLADFDPGPGRVSDIHKYMTDRSVIVNWTEGWRFSHRRYLEVSREWNIGRYCKERLAMPRLLDFITDVSEYWITRFPRV